MSSMSAGVDPGGGKVLEKPAHAVAEPGDGAAHPGVDEEHPLTGIDDHRVEVHRDMVGRQEMFRLEAGHFLGRGVGEDALVAVVDVSIPDDGSFKGPKPEPVPARILSMRQRCAHHVLPIPPRRTAELHAPRNTVL
jgi:hypothetical protein